MVVAYRLRKPAASMAATFCALALSGIDGRDDEQSP
jgi:hypothetical protein